MQDALFLVFLVVGYIVFWCIRAPKNEEEHKIAEEKRGDYIEQNGVVVTAEYTYEKRESVYGVDCGCDIRYRFIVDEQHRIVHILDKAETATRIPFNEIIGCEIICDNQVAGGIGRAVVGGALAGEAGAIVGAVTAKAHIMSYKVILYCLNFKAPSVEMKLIKEKTSTNSAIYHRAVSFANHVNASVKVITSRNAMNL